MTRSEAKAKEFAPVLGWWAAIDECGVVTVRDPSGQVRATYQGTSSKYPSANVPEGSSATIRLPEGEVLLINGRAKATRRHEHNGHLDLFGRHYEFIHRWRWRTEVRCAGRLVAVLRRRSSLRFTLRVNATRDETDLLATVLCWYAVRPGRDGAVAEAFNGL